MKFLSLFPYLLGAWAMLVFAYESSRDGSALGGPLYGVVAVVVLTWGIGKYRSYEKRQPDKVSLIALNAGLLPLLYANLVLLPIMLQGRGINESGMVYVLVLIYGPVLYIGTMLVLRVWEEIRDWCQKRKGRK